MTTGPVISRTSDLGDENYKWGFVTDVTPDLAPKGINEDIVRLISNKKNEPEWLLEWRLKAFEQWSHMTEKKDHPEWANIDYPELDYQDIYYYASPFSDERPKSLDEVDPDMLEAFDKLGIPLHEREKLAGVAVDAVFDSVSVATTYKDNLLKAGVVFCPLSEAIKEYPDLVKTYMGSVVPYTDNYFAALNAAVFTEGSFVYVPKDTVCPMELSTYFRINSEETGQFERTLIICEENASVSYLEGCTAPMRVQVFWR